MKDILAFVGEHLIFTFFMSVIVLQTLIEVSKYVSYAIRGNPNIVKHDNNDE